MKNEWESYINCNHSQYNFTYQDKHMPEAIVALAPSAPSPSSQIKADKQLKAVNITKKGGNKKYTRKSRKSVRKHHK